MSNQALSDEQFRKYIAGLCFREPHTQEDIDAMVAEAMPIIQRQIDQAKEDERRRIVEDLRKQYGTRQKDADEAKGSSSENVMLGMAAGLGEALTVVHAATHRESDAA